MFSDIVTTGLQRALVGMESGFQFVIDPDGRPIAITGLRGQSPDEEMTKAFQTALQDVEYRSEHNGIFLDRHMWKYMTAYVTTRNKKKVAVEIAVHDDRGLETYLDSRLDLWILTAS